MPACYTAVASQDDGIWSENDAISILIDEVERIWSAIVKDDDWGALHDKVTACGGLAAPWDSSG